jgi:flagellar biosynthesis anti-sigma factor FlgM
MKCSRQKKARSHHFSLLQFPRRKKDSSPRCKYAREIRKVLKETPEIRTERVEMLKKAIWAGNYWIESEKIAEKMIKESLLDLIL